MENAQLIALSRQIALERQMDVVANNMANLTTTGFKAEKLLFEEYLMPTPDTQDLGWGDELLSFTLDWATVHDFRPGALVQTGGELDVALEGDGFLVVQTPDGERYTRNGALTLNQFGELVTAQGHQVIADGGFVTFGPGETSITIGRDGSVQSSAGAKGFLRIVEFDDPDALTREGDNLFAGETPLPAVATRVVQGALERSNVSGVTEMAEMVRVTRTYTNLARLIEQQDQLRGTAIETLGSLSA